MSAEKTNETIKAQAALRRFCRLMILVCPPEQGWRLSYLHHVDNYPVFHVTAPDSAIGTK